MLTDLLTGNCYCNEGCKDDQFQSHFDGLMCSQYRTYLIYPLVVINYRPIEK